MIPALPLSFRQALAAEGLPKNGTHLLIGFSGGADSTALLDMLDCLQKEAPVFHLTALHVHHGIRGAEADRDAAFCADFCRKRSIPFACVSFDVPALARASGRSLEEEARTVRYQAFAAHIEAHPSVTHLLTAHHADDQAETVLFRMLRGTSVKGLAGIAQSRCFETPHHAVTLLRPLLSMTHDDLLGYCRARSLSFVTDSTNFVTDTARNRIRHTLLPLAEDIHPGCRDAVLRLASAAAADEDYFQMQCAPILQDLRRESALDADASSLSYPLAPLRQLHPALLFRILPALYGDAVRQFLSVPDTDCPLSAAHLADLQKLCCGDAPKRLSLPGNLLFEVFPAGNRFRFFPAEAAGEKRPSVQKLLLPPETPVRFPGGGVCLLTAETPGADPLRLLPQDLKNIYKLSTSTHINSDKINGSVFLRTRQNSASDRYLCGGSHKTVKEVLSSHKVPPALRQSLPLFCDDAGILYVPFCGIRDSVNPRYAETPHPVTLTYFYHDI